METEANLPQEAIPADVATPEAEAPEETLEETPAAAEPAQEAEAPEAEPEPEAAEAPAEAEAEAPAEAEAAPAEAEAPAEEAAAEPEASSADVVATADVAPARSRMNLARIAKESLIERAKELADSTDWRKTAELQRELMDEWRKAGYAGKEDNDKLWEDFRAARQEFFARREVEVVAIKKQIIQEAHEATENVTNWVATSNALDALMERWKAAGNSGSESDNALWDEFNGIRRDFRNRRKADLDKRRATAQANADAKRAIVEEAKQIAASAEYTRENSDRMRQLDKDYKAIGFAGKPANDTLWAEFSEAKNSYWTGNSALLDERRKRRSERMQEVVERKTDQIEHLKSQNETLTARLGSTLDPDKLAQIKQWIAQNDERAADLEGDVADIKRKI